MKTHTFKTPILITIAILAFMYQGCRPIGSKCSHGPFRPIAYDSFILGYRDAIDTLHFSLTSLKHDHYIFQYDRVPNYVDPEPLLNTNLGFYASKAFSKSDSIALTVRFTYKDKSSYLDSEQRPISIPRLEQLSRLNGDTNFKRMVSGFTVIKTDASGRIVLEDTLHSIKVFANQDYAHYRAGDDISACFTLAYTDPYHIAQTYQTFSKEQAGLDYNFLDYVPNNCFMGYDEPPFDQDKQCFRITNQGKYQWYDGEYFPIIQYRKLSEFEFHKTPYLSSVIALIPNVYPSVPGDYSFTIEAILYYGLVIRATTPLIGFSGQ